MSLLSDFSNGFPSWNLTFKWISHFSIPTPLKGRMEWKGIHGWKDETLFCVVTYKGDITRQHRR